MTIFYVRFAGETVRVKGLGKAKKMADEQAVLVGRAQVRCLLPQGLTVVYEAGR